MQFNPLHLPYSSQRMTVYAKNGMVATSQPLAAQAGLDSLKKGGNAIDAAIATAACLTVLEPTSNGIGGDAFALVWSNGTLRGLNASGPAPKNLTIEKVLQTGVQEMPKFGWLPVTVPGAPAAWVELSSRFGKLPFVEVIQPAIDYAEQGFPLSPILSKYWRRAFETYRQVLKGEEFAHWFQTFAPEGRAPQVGEIWRSSAHANTLRLIAESKARSFYQGELAEKIVSFAKAYNGFLSEEDLASYQPEWVEPIRVNYRGYDIWELPPNGQGLITLMALNILKGFEPLERENADSYHLQMEALKLAFMDGKQYITDPEMMEVKVEELLSEAYAEERRKCIGKTAITPTAGKPPTGGTVYLATADAEGNMVSFIQSNYMGFGSGLVVPGTGISLQNRGHTFSLNRNDSNHLAPGKRTYHTIIPGFVTKDNVAVGPFGVMGGFMQPQGHLQVLVNSIDYHLNPQSALDAPRWQWVQDKQIRVERSLPDHIVQALIRKGHRIEIATDSGEFGRGQIIWRNQDGVLAGGTESRTDGSIAAW